MKAWVVEDFQGKSLLWRDSEWEETGWALRPGLPRHPVLEATAHLHP